MLQLLASIADHEAVGNLPGDEFRQVLHEGPFEDLGRAARLGQSPRQCTQESPEIGVVLHDRPQGGFADVAAFKKLLHEGDGGFLIAFEVGLDLQGGVAGIHSVQFRLDGAELAQPKLVELVDLGKQRIADAGLVGLLLGQRLQHLLRFGLALLLGQEVIRLDGRHAGLLEFLG
ncbi:Uncharacterised protein [Acinetobacter baumannii]|nr:Uncharacterised protein [Acinetobacter baumannii]